MRITSERGSALLIVLLVVATAASAVIGFSYNAMVEIRAAAAFRDRTASYWSAYGAVIASARLISNDVNSYDAPSELWAQKLALQLNDYYVEAEIQDLGGRFALNELINDAGNLNVIQMERLERLFSLTGISDPRSKVQRIADLIDKDRAARISQSETDSLNAPLLTTNELVIHGIFSELELEKVEPYITTFGQVEVNINTAPLIVIMSLEDSIDDVSARMIVDRRGSSSIKNLEMLKEVPGYEDWYYDISQNISTKSDVYEINVKSSHNNSVIYLNAIFNKRSKKFLYWKTI